jgi:hypothetical protein
MELSLYKQCIGKILRPLLTCGGMTPLDIMREGNHAQLKEAANQE